MVPHYYICPRQTVIDYADYFAFGSHMVWADEAKGIVIVKVRLRDEDDHILFMKQPGVEMLPHPVLEQDVDINPRHLTHPDIAKHSHIKAAKASGKGVKIRHLIQAISHPGNEGTTPLMGLTVL